MWYALVILTIASLIWYLSSRRGSITAAQQHHHVSGSGCWELGLFYNRGNRGQDIRTTIQGCKDVLMESWRGEDFAYYGEQMTPLEARAGPNQRLVKGFGIDNAFTTIDEGYHQEFKLKIAKALKTCNQEWLNLWNFSKKATYKSITRQYSDANIRLKFFPDDSKLDEDVAIANVTRLINTIWMDSKCSGDLDSKSGNSSTKTNLFKRRPPMDKSTKNLITLMENLTCILPANSQQNPRQNPLNIILPAYETLWRVVLRLLIETLFRHGDKNGLWKLCLTKLSQKLDNGENFSLHAEVEGRLCVLDIVNEGLRLYPPTKRIYRWEQRENQHRCLYEYPELCAADIEALHRDDKVWGPDVLQFEPERWSRYSAAERKRAMEQFIPFGYGSLSCPAKGDFAPKMIALLVAVLVEEIGSQFEWVATLEKDRVDGVDPLKTQRDSYDTLELKRLESHTM